MFALLCVLVCGALLVKGGSLYDLVACVGIAALLYAVLPDPKTPDILLPGYVVLALNLVTIGFLLWGVLAFYGFAYGTVLVERVLAVLAGQYVKMVRAYPE